MIRIEKTKILNLRPQQGFTLLELLVVIAIIGILASIVLVGLVNVRYKAKNAVIRQEVDELAKLIELEYLESGDYDNLQVDCIVPADCTCADVGFSGIYAPEVVALCEKIVSLAPPLSGTDYRFLMAHDLENDNITYDSHKYSIMATIWTISGIPNYYCAGSSGKFEASTFPDNPEEAVGCYWEP